MPRKPSASPPPPAPRDAESKKKDKKEKPKQWSVRGIRSSQHPQYTVRVVEPKPGAALMVYWWEPGSGQRAMGLGKRTRAMLGPTVKAQQDEAERLGREFIAGLAARDAGEEVRPTGPLTLGALVDEYTTRGLLLVSASYRRDAIGCVRRVRDRLGESFVVSGLKPSHVERYLADRIAANTLVAGRRDMVALSIACNWALANDLLASSPFANPNLKRLLYAKHTPSRPFCTPDEFAKLLAVAPQVVSTVPCTHSPEPAKHFRPDVRHRSPAVKESAAAFPTLLQLAWHTGHRISAILALRWDAVDFTERPEAPFGTLTWYAGVVADRKKYEHTVPMNEPTRQALLTWRDELRRRDVPTIAPWVFPCGPNVERSLDYSNVRPWLLDALKLAKLPKKKFGAWHMFRRGFATARKGMPLRDLASVGGWRDTETLMKSYVHATTEGTLKVALFSA